MPRMRIVSLVPSATEMVAVLGRLAVLVGRSHACDWPPGVKALPALTRPMVPARLTSAGIDREVRRLVEAALAIYRLDGPALKALAPTHILTQTRCEVCAVSLDEVRGAAARFLDRPVEVVSLAPARLADVWDDLRRVGRALGVEPEPVALALEARLATLARRVARRAKAGRPRVACLEWTDPLLAAGYWVPELVRLAGGEPLFGRPGEPAPGIDLEALAAAEPDVIVAMPCGFDLEESARALGALSREPRWARIKAVRAGAVFAADGRRYFNRPGPSLVEAAEILAEILHPDATDLGHEGRAWRRCPG